MPNSEQEVQVSDTTGADSSNTVGQQKDLFQIAYNHRMIHKTTNKNTLSTVSFCKSFQLLLRLIKHKRCISS